MKWSVVLLLVLGVVAAVCAALLVFSMQSGPSGTVATSTDGERPEGYYVVAARDLGARTVVANDAIEMRNASPKDVPLHSFSQPGDVVGKILKKSVKKGEAIERSSISSEGTGVVLAGALQPGQRAVSISLSDSGGVENLLYPGCMVDVLASLQFREDDVQGDQSVAVTLLQGVTVLGVGDQTVVSPPPTDDSRALVQKAPPSTVTLLVDTKQAEMLYLARQRGSVSIALRNPLDDAAVGTEGTRMPTLSQIFREAEERMLKRLEERRKEAVDDFERQREKSRYDMERARFDIEQARKQAEIAKIELDKKRLEVERDAEKTVKPQWETRVVRGSEAKVETFDLPEKAPHK